MKQAEVTLLEGYGNVLHHRCQNKAIATERNLSTMLFA